MIRKYINSKITAFRIAETDGEMIRDLQNKYFIIQIDLPTNHCAIVEYCEYSEIVDLIPFTSNIPTPRQEPQGDLHKVEEYREVVINNDPFGKYGGHSLGEIFDAQDINWINRCIKDMRNDYIKSRVEYLKDHYKKVGAQWIK